MKKLFKHYVALSLLLLVISCTKDGFKPANKSIVQSENLPQDEMVITPFGDFPRSRVFMVEDGFITKVQNNQVLKFELSTGKVVEVLANLQPSNLIVSKTNGSQERAVAPWHDLDVVSVSNTAPTNGDDFYTKFSANFIVPSAPTTQGVTIFTGLRLDVYDGNGESIVAALQYGPSYAGGGSYWSATTWYLNTVAQVVTFKQIVTNVTPGTKYNPYITWDATNNYYRANCGFGSDLIYQPLSPSPVNSNGVPESIASIFLSETPKSSTPLYTSQQVVQFTNINMQASGSPASLTWGTSGPVGGNLTGPNGELIKVVSNSNTNGEVDVYLTSYYTVNFVANPLGGFLVSSMYYSLNNGSTWVLASNNSTITVPSSTSVVYKGIFTNPKNYESGSADISLPNQDPYLVIPINSSVTLQTSAYKSYSNYTVTFTANYND